MRRSRFMMLAKKCCLCCFFFPLWVCTFKPSIGRFVECNSTSAAASPIKNCQHRRFRTVSFSHFRLRREASRSRRQKNYYRINFLNNICLTSCLTTYLPLFKYFLLISNISTLFVPYSMFFSHFVPCILESLHKPFTCFFGNMRPFFRFFSGFFKYLFFPCGTDV